ncbi:MAG TPA: polyketide cyclase [Actinocrinis sp.]|nr:polyketide cyclase [Actinocrinis sp.]
MWSTEYSTETDLAPETVWTALRDWSTGVVPPANGDRHELHGEFAVGSTIASSPEGLGIVLETTIVTLTENEVFEAETPFNGLILLNHYSLRRLADGGTHITHKLVIGGDAADEMGPTVGPRISEDYPESMEDLLAVARKL